VLGEENRSGDGTVDPVVVIFNLLSQQVSTVPQPECGLIRLETSGLKTQVDTMKELIDKLTEEDRALRARPRTPATVPPPPPTTSTPPPRPKCRGKPPSGEERERGGGAGRGVSGGGGGGGAGPGGGADGRTSGGGVGRGAAGGLSCFLCLFFYLGVRDPPRLCRRLVLQCQQVWLSVEETVR
jgi:hypothetical protein